MREDLQAAEALAACRRAVELGDDTGMSTLALARALIGYVRVNEMDEATLDADASEQMLNEAEEQLQLVTQQAPEARLSFWQGMIQWYRGDQQEALTLLRRGVDETGQRSSYAAAYISYWMSSEDAKEPFAETTGSFVDEFPDDASIQALHAVALYRDQRFTDAYTTLQKANEIDADAVQRLGPEAVSAIEQGRWFTPLVMEGVKLAEANSHREAVVKYRQAVAADPENLVAAQLLSRSLLNRDDPRFGAKVHFEETADEVTKLSERFPEDPELHVARAAALYRMGRNIEAVAALDRSEELGGNLRTFMPRSAESSIRQAARQDRTEQYFLFTLLSGFIVSVTWLSVMFGLAAVLAMCTSRIPGAGGLSTHDTRRSSEVWLERFYLLVLGLSLLFFYISVPFVSLGLLAITVLMLAVMLVIRFIHFGLSVSRALCDVGCASQRFHRHLQ